MLLELVDGTRCGKTGTGTGTENVFPSIFPTGTRPHKHLRSPDLANLENPTFALPLQVRERSSLNAVKIKILKTGYA